MRYSGYEVHTQVVDAMDRDSVQAFAKKAESLGLVMYFIDTAGASPNQASPEHIVKLDLIATAVAYDEFNAAGEGYQKMIEASSRAQNF